MTHRSDLTRTSSVVEYQWSKSFLCLWLENNLLSLTPPRILSINCVLTFCHENVFESWLFPLVCFCWNKCIDSKLLKIDLILQYKIYAVYIQKNNYMEAVWASHGSTWFVGTSTNLNGKIYFVCLYVLSCCSVMESSGKGYFPFLVWSKVVRHADLAIMC